jgi:hypothetical protein
LGKASRNKRERSLERAVSAITESRVPIDLLRRAVEEIGQLYGTIQDCAGAAALLQETGRLLGYELTARPVSLLATHAASRTQIVMGRRATERVVEAGPIEIEDHLHGGRDTGHMVVTCDDPPMLMDANLFGQLAPHGIKVRPLCLDVLSAHPKDGMWITEHDGLDMVYISDDTDQSLVPRFEVNLRECKPHARSLAGALRASAGVR